MKIKYFENIVKYLPVLLACILIGLFGREHFIKKGADEFTVHIIFWIYVGLGILIFALIILFLEPVVRLVLKPLSKNVKTDFIENEIADENENHNEGKNNDENDYQNEANPTESIEVIVENSIDTEEVRKIDREKELQEYQEKLQIAINYTKVQFAPYLSDEGIDLLCNAIQAYSKQEKISSDVSIKIYKLSNLDLYHFGWNIWKHFEVSNQLGIAIFLKSVFADALKDVEVESIKRHLKDDERKGMIKITDNLSDF